MMRKAVLCGFCFLIPWLLGVSQDRIRETVRQEILSGGDTLNQTRTESHYQGDDLVKRKSFLWEKGMWKLKSTDEYRYNRKGNVLWHRSRIYSEDFRTLFLESVLEQSYLYDTLPEASRYARYVFEEQTSVFRSETKAVYNTNGLPVSSYYKYKESRDGPWNGNLVEREYDQNNCLTRRSVSQLVNEQEWVQFQEVLFTRDASCRPETEYHFQWQGGNKVETFAELNSYEHAPGLIRTSTYRRLSPTSAWQIYRENELRTTGDSLVSTEIFHELTYTIRHRRITVHGNEVQQTSEIKFVDENDFRLTNLINYFYSGDLVIRTVWEERSQENKVTGSGTADYTYNAHGNILSYESEQVQNGTSSTYSQYYNYLCDGNLGSIRSVSTNQNGNTHSLLTYAWYGDPPCNGPDFENALVLYPNPASSDLWFYSRSDLANARVEIIDPTGKVVLATRPTGPSYSSIDISSLKAGAYILRLRTEIDQFSARFIKYH